MKLLILGAGEYGQLVKELAKNKYTTIDFLDDHSDIAVGPLSEYKKLRGQYNDAIVAIGNNKVRMDWLNKLEELGYKLPILISDKAYISPSAIIEPGVIIEPMAIINTSTVVMKGSIISAGAVINHNSIVQQGCHIDCNAVVGANAVVPANSRLYYGQVLAKVDKSDNWELSK